MKRLMALVLAMFLLVSCSSSEQKQSDKAAVNSNEKKGEKIAVLSREDGSGTRGAFVEIFKLTKEENGKKVDQTVSSAEITNSTSVMITSVESNKNAIGYISLGTLNDKVKALEVDGAAATAENIKAGRYKVQRPFNIVTGEKSSPLKDDFIGFIMSEQGQKIVSEKGYVPVDAKGQYKGDVEGKLIVAGSSSVSPLMEVLIEKYKAINPKANIELQQSDSTTGVNAVIEGVADIGMASRELKDSEKQKNVKPLVIAIDGIAIIVNKENAVKSVTSDQIKKIYAGELTNWDEVK